MEFNSQKELRILNHNKKLKTRQAVLDFRLARAVVAFAS